MRMRMMKNPLHTKSVRSNERTCEREECNRGRDSSSGKNLTLVTVWIRKGMSLRGRIEKTFVLRLMPSSDKDASNSITSNAWTWHPHEPLGLNFGIDLSSSRRSYDLLRGFIEDNRPMNPSHDEVLPVSCNAWTWTTWCYASYSIFPSSLYTSSTVRWLTKLINHSVTSWILFIIIHEKVITGSLHYSPVVKNRE